MGRRAESRPIERVVAPAAYLHRPTASPPTRADIVSDVPGYPQGDEANRKALRRDLSDLEAHLGIATDYDQRDDSYHLQRPFFTPKERDALVAAAAITRVRGLGEPDPDDIGGGVDDDGHRVFVTVPRRVLALCESIRSRTPAMFRYHGAERVLHAYALGEVNNRWYVTGLEHGPDETRIFRVDRIEGQVQVVGGPGAYDIPDAFDAAAAIRGVDPFTWGADPPVASRVLLDPDHAQGFLRDYGGAVVESADDGVVVEVEVAHYDAFRRRLLAFGIRARVLAPPVLVDHVRSHLAAIAGR